MSFLGDTVPWGSPTVADIPLPPFADEAEHRHYLRALQLHIALLDDAGPALPTIALGALLEPARSAPKSAWRWPSAAALSASLSTWFPAPWTPETLAETLKRVNNDAPGNTGVAWRWGGDPDFSARPKDGGGWEITRHERGALECESLRDDRDLVLCWIGYYRARFIFPLGWRYEDEDVRAMAPATRAVLAADARDAEYAYRSSWRSKRAGFLAGD